MNKQLIKSSTINNKIMFLSKDTLQSKKKKYSFIEKSLTLDNNKLSNELISILSKAKRKDIEVDQIKKFLMGFSSFSGYLQLYYNCFDDLIYLISNKIKYEYLQQYKFLFKIGEIGDKFYIILKGSVSIIIKESTVVCLSFYQYFEYMCKLIILNEVDLFLKNSDENVFTNHSKEELFKLFIDISRYYEKNKFEINENELNMRMKQILINNCLQIEINVMIKIIYIKTRIKITERFILNNNRSLFSMTRQFSASIMNNNIYQKNNMEKYNLNKRRYSININESSILSISSKLKNLENNNIQNGWYFNVEYEQYDLNMNIVDYIFYLTNFSTNSNDNNSLNIKKTLKLIIPKFHSELKAGDNFGETAINNKNKLRTASIYTNEDTHFGVFDNKLFRQCIFQIELKQKGLNMINLRNNQLFKNCSQNVFRYIVERLSTRKLQSGEYILRENIENNEMIFIISGEFEITCSKSLLELINLYKYFSGKKDYMNNITNQKENILLNKKKNMSIGFIETNCIVGLRDIINEDKYSYFNLVCKSKKAEILKGNSDNIYKICNNDSILKANLKSLISDKISILLLKLKNIISNLVKIDMPFENTMMDQIKNENKSKKLKNESMSLTYSKKIHLPINIMNKITVKEKTINTTRNLKRGENIEKLSIKYQIEKNNKFNNSENYDERNYEYSRLSSNHEIRNGTMVQVKKIFELNKENYINISSFDQKENEENLLTKLNIKQYLNTEKGIKQCLLKSNNEKKVFNRVNFLAMDDFNRQFNSFLYNDNKKNQKIYNMKDSDTRREVNMNKIKNQSISLTVKNKNMKIHPSFYSQDFFFEEKVEKSIKKNKKNIEASNNILNYKNKIRFYNKTINNGTKNKNNYNNLKINLQTI